jgi:hypothetical protein
MGQVPLCNNFVHNPPLIPNVEFSEIRVVCGFRWNGLFYFILYLVMELLEDHCKIFYNLDMSN